MIEENFRFRHREEEIPVRVRSGSPGDVSVSITLGGVVHDFRISRNFTERRKWAFFRTRKPLENSPKRKSNLHSS
ncbi:hypothetical protein LEP1GSC151_2518 [Leptospira interrogans serovar Grippotyphosa str. LT2186]|uniref:Uncharacterized protein n=1 Tax=Leptospira interrogans serovar Grippotyphosa str. LT2186 TaxID=1001599 RepID=M3I4H1_LEPIR|nr:hypothetical protein LEP1GSC151_2518 [Leptospira interrogans serovar Grippotyphosa str. LT2186]